MSWTRRILVVAPIAAACAAGALTAGSDAADHGDSPQTRIDPRLDIPDMYIFQSPQTPANTTMIMTTAPLARIVSQNNFTPGAKYEFRIDEDGDAKPDSAYTVTFGKVVASTAVPPGPSTQSMTVQYKGTAQKFKAKGVSGTELALPNGGKIIAKEFDDPFFFDFIGFRAGYQFSAATSKDFFPGLNIMAIVLEVPSTTFSDNTIGLWGVTLQGKKQIDRNGRPVINSVLIPGPMKDAFNRGKPENDVRDFRATAITTLVGLGNTQMQAEGIADILLPDILTFDTSNAAGFLNGRRPEDDVVDAALGVASSGALTTDFVPLTDQFLTTFPYLLPPNK